MWIPHTCCAPCSLSAAASTLMSLTCRRSAASASSRSDTACDSSAARLSRSATWHCSPCTTCGSVGRGGEADFYKAASAAACKHAALAIATTAELWWSSKHIAINFTCRRDVRLAICAAWRSAWRAASSAALRAAAAASAAARCCAASSARSAATDSRSWVQSSCARVKHHAFEWAQHASPTWLLARLCSDRWASCCLFVELIFIHQDFTELVVLGRRFAPADGRR